MSQDAPVGRADLLRLLARADLRDGERIARIAALCGYGVDVQDLLEDPEPDQAALEPKAAEPRQGPAFASAPLDPVSFLYPGRFTPLESPGGQGDEPRAAPPPYQGWRKKPPPPVWRPLAYWRELEPLLKTLLRPAAPSHRVDIRKTVDRVAKAAYLDRLPYEDRINWVLRLTLIVDRSERLTPYWRDQRSVATALRLSLPECQFRILVYDEDANALMDQERRQVRPADLAREPAMALVLGDLGVLSARPERTAGFWLALGDALGVERAAVLTPAPPSSYPQSLQKRWRFAHWDHTTLRRGGETAEAATLAHRLLTLAAPAVRLEPGLLRAIRIGALPEAGAEIEAMAWRSPRLRHRGSVAGDFDPHQVLRAQFPEEPEAVRGAALESIRIWRALGHPSVWFEDASRLDPASRTLIPAEDMEDAAAYFKAIREEIGGPVEEGRRIDLEAWFDRMGDRIVDDPPEDENLRALVWSVKQHDPAFAGFEPGSVPPPSREVGAVRIAQQGGGLAFGVEAEGSLLALAPSRDGLIRIEPIERPPWAVEEGEDQYGRWARFEVEGVSQTLRWCPPGRFLMGSPKDEKGRFSAEGSQVEITFAEGFWMFDTAVSQALYRAVTGENPSSFKGDDLPVENVSWHDAQAFVAKLSEKLPGLALRLPSEAEWEYACRAGSATPFEPTVAAKHDGLQITTEEVNFSGAWELGEEARFGEPRNRTVSVKGEGFRPNAWGLWHMHGNVDEWCADAYQSNHEGADPAGLPRTSSQQVGGSTNAEGSDDVERDRVIRGGAWVSVARVCRAACRGRSTPEDRYDDLGFRCSAGQVVSPARQEQEGAERPGFRAEARERGARPAPVESPPRQRRGESVRVTPHSGARLAQPPPTPFLIRTDLAELRIERFARDRLPWARRLGRDGFGLWAVVRLDGPPLRMRFCPPGRFTMGSPETEPGRDDDEGPQTEISFAEGFWMADTPVTVAQWRRFIDATKHKVERGAYGWTGIDWIFNEKLGWADPGFDQDENAPVTCVGWEDASAYLAWLNDAAKAGGAFGLPSEAAWEYACRAGTTAATYAGPMEILGANNAPILDEIARYAGNSGLGYEDRRGVDSSNWPEKQYDHQKAGTHAVRGKTPNPWGLYDTLGNVWEWCADIWRASHEGANPAGLSRTSSQQGGGPTNSEGGDDDERHRVIRGGGWHSHARLCRAAFRNRDEPEDRFDDLGFRCSAGQVVSPASGRRP